MLSLPGPILGPRLTLLLTVGERAVSAVLAEEFSGLNLSSRDR